jgi:hypothetical protein
MNVYYLLFRRQNGKTYPIEIAAYSLHEAIYFVQDRDNSTFVQEITFG